MFAEHLHSEVLAQVPHRHIGFGIPKRLRWLFKRNRSLLSLLPQAAAQAVRQMYRELAPAGDIGLVLTVQTWADNALPRELELLPERLLLPEKQTFEDVRVRLRGRNQFQFQDQFFPHFLSNYSFRS